MKQHNKFERYYKIEHNEKNVHSNFDYIKMDSQYTISLRSVLNFFFFARLLKMKQLLKEESVNFNTRGNVIQASFREEE